MADNEQNDYGETLAQWDFPEFIKQKRSTAWYFWLIVLFGALLVYAFININFLFAIIIIMSAIVFYLIYRREPEQIIFRIMEDGVESDGHFFPYELAKHFFIIYKPPEIMYLFVEFKSTTKPRLNIPLMNQNPLEIRRILAEYLTENLEKEDEPLSNYLTRVLKL
jgi:hypothetical protein